MREAVARIVGKTDDDIAICAQACDDTPVLARQIPKPDISALGPAIGHPRAVTEIVRASHDDGAIGAEQNRRLYHLAGRQVYGLKAILRGCNASAEHKNRRTRWQAQKPLSHSGAPQTPKAALQSTLLAARPFSTLNAAEIALREALSSTQRGAL
jgi:hypothetical protein